MADGLTPLVAFPLVAFAALAVPSVIASVLFGMVRKDPPAPSLVRRRGVRRFTPAYDRDPSRYRRIGRAGRE
jgi:hypothetical protein